jgi:AraC family transcriptional regulator, regulatory protein of adaptative response / DNA-3-methyladenine glycosylase II
VAIDGALAEDPRLASAVAKAPGIRMPGALDPAEMLIRAMIGQQITVAAARTALTQLAAVGSSSRSPGEGLDRMFPTPAEIAADGCALLRGPRKRIDALRAAASALSDGTLDFGYGDDVASLGAKLLPLVGVGAWTVGYLAMRVLGAPDVFLGNDAAVRNGIKALDQPQDYLGSGSGGAGTPSPDFREVSPWRSYATMRLWRAAAHPAAGARHATRTDAPRAGSRTTEKAIR